MQLQSFGKRSTEDCAVAGAANHVMLNLNKQSQGVNYEAPTEGEGSTARVNLAPEAGEHSNKSRPAQTPLRKGLDFRSSPPVHGASNCPTTKGFTCSP